MLSPATRGAVLIALAFVLLCCAGAGGSSSDKAGQEDRPSVRRGFPIPANWIVCDGQRETFRAEAEGEYDDVAIWEVRGPVEWTLRRPVSEQDGYLSSTLEFRFQRSGQYRITCTFSGGGRTESVSWAVTVDDNEWPAYGRKVEPEEPGTMAFIKGGTFKMGRPRPAFLADDRPEHEVRVDDFYIGKYLVTAKEFCEFLNDRGNPDCRYLLEDELLLQKYIMPMIKARGYPAEGSWEYRWTMRSAKSCPVYRDPETGRYLPRGNQAFFAIVQVTWFGAVEYCRWLSQQTGGKYRLPTEAEWEYAARGKEGRKYPWGWEEPVPGGKGRDRGRNREFGGEVTGNVGSFVAANTPEGLADMAGGPYQWCSDMYHHRYYSVAPRDNPKGPEVSKDEWATAPRVLRNSASHASWNGFWTTYWFDPAWARQRLEPTVDGERGYIPFRSTGFRVVMEPDATPSPDSK